MEGSTGLPRTVEDSRLCKGVDWPVLFPRRSGGEARLCDADLSSSGMRGRIVWPGPALAGCEATGRFKCQCLPFAPIAFAHTFKDYRNLIAQSCKEPCQELKVNWT